MFLMLEKKVTCFIAPCLCFTGDIQSGWFHRQKQRPPIPRFVTGNVQMQTLASQTTLPRG